MLYAYDPVARSNECEDGGRDCSHAAGKPYRILAAFQSSPFKEVTVFSLLIPVLLWRSYTLLQPEEDGEE